MAASKEIEQRIAAESERRARLGVPAVAGGVLYLLSGIILSSTLSNLPAVGLVQGFAPLLQGKPTTGVSPRAAEVTYINHHAFGLIAGGVLTAIAVACLTVVLLFIVAATAFRRPEAWSGTRPLVLFGGGAFALLSVVHWVAISIKAHSFTGGHDFSSKAVDQALLTAGSLGVTLALLGLLAALAIAIGTIAAMVAAMRAGLLPRWLAVLGIFAGLLFLPLFGTSTLDLVPAFWLVAIGILLMGRWPSGDPPAWAAGESRPWPTQAELRARRADASD